VFQSRPQVYMLIALYSNKSYVDQPGPKVFGAPYSKLLYFSARKVVSLALLLSSAKPFLLGLNLARKEAN
jgi:hypothetical protein